MCSRSLRPFLCSLTRCRVGAVWCNLCDGRHSYTFLELELKMGKYWSTTHSPSLYHFPPPWMAGSLGRQVSAYGRMLTYIIRLNSHNFVCNYSACTHVGSWDCKYIHEKSKLVLHIILGTRTKNAIKRYNKVPEVLLSTRWVILTSQSELKVERSSEQTKKTGPVTGVIKKYSVPGTRYAFPGSKSEVCVVN